MLSSHRRSHSVERREARLSHDAREESRQLPYTHNPPRNAMLQAASEKLEGVCLGGSAFNTARSSAYQQ